MKYINCYTDVAKQNIEKALEHEFPSEIRQEDQRSNRSSNRATDDNGR